MSNKRKKGDRRREQQMRISDERDDTIFIRDLELALEDITRGAQVYARNDSLLDGTAAREEDGALYEVLEWVDDQCDVLLIIRDYNSASIHAASKERGMITCSHIKLPTLTEQYIR